jgi:SAM-dependent methyltransferase
MGTMVSSAQIFELFSAHWTTAILANGVLHDVFGHVDRGENTAIGLTKVLGFSERATQALLDGLVGIGVLEVIDGRYENTPAASDHLVPGKPGYMGGFARIVTSDGDGGMRQWSRLGDALASSRPVTPETILAPDHPFWPELAVALQPLTVEVAHKLAEVLAFDAMVAPRVLDVGGGSGAFGLAWLPRNTRAQVTQLDWEPMNRLARTQLERIGQAERFIAIDGDMRAEPWGEAFDFVVLSNVLHHEPPAGNVELLTKAHRALGRGGRVLVSEFLIEDDRRGPSFAMRFFAGMVLQTAEGRAYTKHDVQSWLAAAGFTRVEVLFTHGLSTVVAGTKD